MYNLEGKTHEIYIFLYIRTLFGKCTSTTLNHKYFFIQLKFQIVEIFVLSGESKLDFDHD